MASGIFGVSSLTVDGEPLNVEGDVTIVDSEQTVEATADVLGNVFLKETGRAGRITASIYVATPAAQVALRRKRNATVVAACRNGQAFILRSASAVGEWSYSMADGKVSAEFAGRGEWDGT